MATATDDAIRPLPPAGMKWAPLVPLLMAVSSGILVDRFIDPWETMTWAALAIGAGLAGMLATTRRVAANLAVVAAFAAIGGGWHHHRWSDRAADDLGEIVSEDPLPARIRGTVWDLLGTRPADRDRPGSDGPRTRFVVEISSSHDGRDWRPASGRAIVAADGDYVDLAEGEMVELTGRISRLEGPLNPGEFDYRGFLRSQGISIRLSVIGDGGVRPAPESQGPGWLGRTRAWCRDRLLQGMGPQTGPLATALLLGRREGVDPEVNDAFARTGTTHLLAISGLHMQAMAAALVLAARLAAIPDRPAALLISLCTIAYAVLVGPAPSVVRSAIMTVAFCLAAILGRMTMPANILALAGLGTLAVNPVALFDVGGQLSFLAVAALIWLVPPADEAARHVWRAIRHRVFGPRSPLDDLERTFEAVWKKELRKAGAWLLSGILASTVVFLAALPIVALRFHIVSPIGILLNIPLIAITTVAMLLGGIGLLLSAIWEPMGMPMARGAGVLLDLTRRIVVWGVEQSWGHWFSAGPGWRWILIFYVALGVAAVAETASRRRRRALERLPEEARDVPDPGRFRRRGAWTMVAIWSLIGMLMAAFPPRPATAEADVLAVGHGLAVAVQAPNGRVLLYDCGRMGDPTVGRRIVAPALWSRGIGRIDEVVLSHADQDHFDGLPDLLNRFQVGEVRVPPGFGGPRNPAADRLLAMIQARGIPVVETASPASWEMSGVRMTVRHPPDGWFPDASDNARSLVLDVEQGGRHLLLTGDLEQIGLIEMIGGPRPDPPIEVLLSPHHGGRSANPASLYEWARPAKVVVSQRAPRSETGDALTPLEEGGLDVRRTWRDGAIRLRWSDHAIVATNFLQRPELTTEVRTGSPAFTQWPIGMIGIWPIARRLAEAMAGLVVGLLLWAVMAIVEFGAWTLVVHPTPRREVPDDVLDSRPIETKAIDGVRLAGRFYGAGGEREPLGMVLLLHGFADDPSVWEGERASILNAAGWDVAALDARGYGQSDGMYASFGGREAGDVSAWLDAMDCPGKIVAVWGRSMGAAITMRAASVDSRISAVVLESPMVDLDASVARLLRNRGLRLARPMAWLITRRAGRIAGVSLSRPRPVEVAQRVGCPTMFVHGTDDWLVPKEDVSRLAEAFPTNPDRIEVPGAGHSNVVEGGSTEVVGRIVAFLNRARESVDGMPSDLSGEM